MLLDASRNMANRFRNPLIFSSEDLRILVGITKEEFIEFCRYTAPASPTRNVKVSHESRVFLFLYRYKQGASCDVLSVLFEISRQSCMTIFNDVLFYLFYHDPHIPRMWNDETATSHDIEVFLREVAERQSPSIRWDIYSRICVSTWLNHQQTFRQWLKAFSYTFSRAYNWVIEWVNPIPSF